MAVAEDDGTPRGWGRVAFFVGVMVSVFVSAFVIGRLVGPDAPGGRPDAPPGQGPASSTLAPGGDSDGGHDHGLAPLRAGNSGPAAPDYH